MNKYIKFLADPEFRFNLLASKGLYNWMSDDVFIRKTYKLSYGVEPNLENPVNFNEKLCWLKLHDRRALYTQLADKLAVREYIKEKIGPEYLIPLVGGPWKKFEDIDFDKLPNQFVLKCTHDSGSVMVCSDKSSFNISAAKKKLTKRLRRNYYYGKREWAYKDVPPRIIAEEYLHSNTNYPESAKNTPCISPAQLQAKAGLLDYKFMCFDGKVKVLSLDIGVIGSTGQTADEYYRNLYDPQFNLLPVRETRENYPIPIEKPKNYELMIELAEKLSQSLPHLRVDMYNLDGRIIIGELTLYHGSGLGNFFDPPHWGDIFGSWLELPTEP